MSPVSASATNTQLIRELGWDVRRGTAGMLLFILTEAMLFVSLFFAYFYFGSDEPTWPTDPPPKLPLALIMVVVLAASSVVLEWGRRQGKKGRDRTARGALAVTLLLGAVFLLLQTLEYREHLKTLHPTDDAYGSIFYTITSFHGAHLLLGLLMMAYVLFLPQVEPTTKPPHRPYHNAALYWHFVDLVWIVIVAVLYVAPNVHRG